MRPFCADILQDRSSNMTKLSPLEEALFRGWATANGVDNHDDPENSYDHRGFYKQTNGMVHPPNAINNAAMTFNKLNEGQMDSSIAQEHQQAQQDAAKKALIGHLKQKEQEHSRELEIADAKHTLQQLLIKKHLGL